MNAIPTSTQSENKPEGTFEYVADQFADLRVLRYRVPDFDVLPLNTKKLLYYLYQAALSGRDMMYDQNYKYNLYIRKTIEGIVKGYAGDRNSEDYKKFLVYAKRVWFSNGIHHHYNSIKFVPECSENYFKELVKNTADTLLPLKEFASKDDFVKWISPIIFDMSIAPKKVELNPQVDMVKNSAVNFYEGITQKEAEDFYSKQINHKDTTPVMYGLNSKLVKENNTVVEHKWHIGGMYHPAIEKIVYWLQKAVDVAENDKQKAALLKLIEFYKTGDLKTFDEYNILWVKDTESAVDVVNGFIEVYNDPLGKKGSFESVVSVKDFEASKRIATIGANAQWFEDNSPIQDNHKKKNVVGISAKVINAVVESGDAAPTTPIGINLPNNEWIREKHGSKSVNLGNIVEAYDNAAGSSVVDEFYFGDEVKKRVKEYAPLADKLHTDMHEVIGHASGQLEPGVKPSHETLKNYASALEEARADLVALYYLLDPKLVELGVMPSLDYGKAAYDDYITRGLMIQLARIKLVNQLEEAHMRNRHLIAMWCLLKGSKNKVIERIEKDGKTYFVINDYQELRKLFGELLKEIQRIKSQGDYEAGKNLVETYGVRLEPELHKQVLERYNKLGIPPYSGFIQPKLVPEYDKQQNIIDVKLIYPKTFVEQMIEYGDNYSFLPVNNK